MTVLFLWDCQPNEFPVAAQSAESTATVTNTNGLQKEYNKETNSFYQDLLAVAISSVCISTFHVWDILRFVAKICSSSDLFQ